MFTRGFGRGADPLQGASPRIDLRRRSTEERELNRGIVCVAGLRGGVGASSLAAHLAVASGGVVVDLHRDGAGLDVTLGIENSAGARWPELVAARGELDPAGVLESLPLWRGTPVLSRDKWHGTPTVEHVSRGISALARIRPVVLDTSLSMVAELSSATADRSLDSLVLVGGTDIPSVAAGHAEVTKLGQDPEFEHLPVGVVVRIGRRRAMAPVEVADLIGAPLWAVLAEDRALYLDAEHGYSRQTLTSKPSHPMGMSAQQRRTVDAALGGKPSKIGIAAQAVCVALGDLTLQRHVPAQGHQTARPVGQW